MLWLWAVVNEHYEVEDEGILTREDAERCAKNLNEKNDGHTYTVDLLPL